ncbi:MAG TPA: TIGR02757 family protein [Puia sp.]|nr:TIGR02757 family protein [Puia sp.]
MLTTSVKHTRQKPDIREFLERKVDEYNRRSFVQDDPISIPGRFSKEQDIEIAAFFTAIFSWGNRTTIIRKSEELMRLMDNAPHAFCLEHDETALKKLTGFKHRTFNSTDLLYFIEFLQFHYRHHESLETAFSQWMSPEDETVENGLRGFYHYFFSLEDVPSRTRKHIASPEKNATCKRLSMFLRWMVRQDDRGVDFGLWKNISPSQLLCPVDIHVARVAKRFGLLTRKQTDWQAALELTRRLQQFDPRDPARYDFALFGLGVAGHY